MANTYALVVCRSDHGDGGWSIHAPGATSEQIADGTAPPLLTGTARRASGLWNRPSARDFRKARALLAPATNEPPG
jgi:hypothetical protein